MDSLQFIELTNRRKRYLCGRACEAFGDNHQLYIAIEEMAELTQELTKHLRGNTRPDSIVEELADLHIIAEEVQQIMAITDVKLYSQIAKKLDRLEKRIELHDDTYIGG